MGKLTYDSTVTVDFDDRVLAHLQLVILSKLRRGESFYFSWKADPAIGDGRNALWIHPSVPLHFKYATRPLPQINGDWLDALLKTAHSSAGLHLVPEPAPPQVDSPSSPKGTIAV